MNNTRFPSRPRDGQPALVKDIKAQATRLRKIFADTTSLTHAQALEKIAQVHGYETWGQLNAHLRNGDPSSGQALNMVSSLDFDPGALITSGLAGRPLCRAWLVSEVELAQRLSWHCSEGTLGAAPEDYAPMLWVLQRLVDADAFRGQPPVSGNLWTDTPASLKQPNVKIETIKRAQEEAEAKFAASVKARAEKFEAALRASPEFDADLHLPALELLLELVDSGTLAQRPQRAVTSYQEGPEPTSASLDRGWRHLMLSAYRENSSGMSDKWADFTGFEDCPHAVIFGPDQEDRYDFLDPALRRIQSGRQSILPVDLHPYEGFEMVVNRDLYSREPWLKAVREDKIQTGYMATRLEQSLRVHTDGEVDGQFEDLVDVLLHNHARSERRRMGRRAPLVVAVKWHPHDLYLPAKLPDLRADNIFVVSLVTPAAYTPVELQRLKALMDNSGWWVLAPGSELPPVPGIERVRNENDHSVMLRRE